MIALNMKGIDQFCGFGGSSEGAKMAGYEIAWAGNHNELAIQVHELNNPTTQHACEDVFLTNYIDDVPDFDFLMSSPACQGHSTASQPRRRRYHEAQRAVACRPCTGFQTLEMSWSVHGDKVLRGLC